MQSSKDPPDDKQNNDDKKLPSMLAKAMLWMFNGYMLITLVSLMFPGGNQPEIVRSVINSFLNFSNFFFYLNMMCF